MKLAVETKKPLFLHERDAHERFVAIMKQYKDKVGKAVVHCFTGTEKELDTYLDMGLYIGKYIRDPNPNLFKSLDN